MVESTLVPDLATVNREMGLLVAYLPDARSAFAVDFVSQDAAGVPDAR